MLGVPLNCSAGLNADAVALLQEAGMWQAAAALTARTLTGTERAQALSRWASHVRHHEGSVWRCVGILTSAGCLQAAAQVGGWGGDGPHALRVVCRGGERRPGLRTAREGLQYALLDVFVPCGCSYGHLRLVAFRIYVSGDRVAVRCLVLCRCCGLPSCQTARLHTCRPAGRRGC